MMLALAIVGLIMHSDMRLISADVVGGFAAISVVVMGSRRGKGVFAIRALAIIALLVIAILSLTSHAAPWLTALTLAGAFVLAFMSWTSISPRGPADTAGRPPSTSA
jgi:hypothetical protein